MTEQTSGSAKGKKKASRRNEFIGFRCPTGWREEICRQAGTDNISEAVIQAVAAHYGLKYKQLDVGRKPKQFTVDVTSPHPTELIDAVFASYSQPWGMIRSKSVAAGVPVERTFVSCKSSDGVSNSEEVGRTRGVELAREIAKAIDDAAAEFDDESED